MKRLFKFFPVALAVLALASCSDDLQLADGQKIQLDKNKLYVQVEGDDATRGGFASAIYENSKGVNSLFNALYFEKDDRIKVYCDESNWRSQVWKLDEPEQYLNKTGVSSFVPVGDEPKYVQDDEVAYGIFPYVNNFDEEDPTLDAVDFEYGWFANERRTEMGFRFLDQAKVVYSAEDITYNKSAGGTVPGTFYKTPFPLWGKKAAGASVMTMKYLTGILRIDFVVPADAAAGSKNYLVIVADKQLNGDFVAKNLKPDELGSKAPVLTGAATIVGAPVSDAIMAADGTVQNNAIVVDLGVAKGHKMVYLPLPAQLYANLKVYSAYGIADGTALANTGIGENMVELYDIIANDLIDTENEAQNVEAPVANTVYPGKWYRVIDDSENKDSEASSPFQMVQAIIEADGKAYRDFTITFTKDILVDNTDDAPQRQWIDFADEVANYGLGEAYTLNHKVTVNVKFKGVAANQVLKINNIGGEQLTLNITQDATNPVDVFVGEKLSSNLVLKSANQIPYLTNESTVATDADGKQTKGLTVSAPVYQIETSGEMNIKNEWTDNVNFLLLNRGVKKVNLLSGVVKTLRCNATEGKTINEDVTIYSEGRSYIQAVDFKTVPQTKGADNKYNDDAKLLFKSKWTNDASMGAFAATLFIMNTAADNIEAITTAAQLAAYAGDADANIIGKYDLNEGAWVSKALTKSFAGAEYIARPANNAGANVSGVMANNATIENLKSANGLFATITPAADLTVQNLTFATKNTVTGTATGKVGLLAGEIAAGTGVVTIKNIDVQGANTISAAGASAAIGGVIGKVSHATELANVKVNATTTVEGHKYVGGIIGEAAAQTTLQATKDGTPYAYNGAAGDPNDVFCTFAGDLSKLITHKVGNAQYSENFAKKGTLIGAVTKSTLAAPVTIFLPAMIEKTNDGVQAADALWAELKLGELFHHALKTYYAEVGLSGVKGHDAANAPELDATNVVGKSIIFNAKSAPTSKYNTTRAFSISVADAEPSDNATTNLYYLNYVSSKVVE